MHKIFAKFKGVGSRLFRIPVTQTSFSCHGNLTVVTNNPPLKGVGVEGGGGERGCSPTSHSQSTFGEVTCY